MGSEAPSASNQASVHLSTAVSHLEGESRQRYVDKLTQLGINDPYSLPQGMFTYVLNCDAANLPDFHYHDLYTYLIHNSSDYTGEALKAYKSLEAYKYFVAGFVTRLEQWAVPGTDIHLIQAKVGHSQRLGEADLKPWTAIRKDGTVLFAHCTCMAGLGEVCSHVAAVMFATDAAVQLVNSRTCTDGPCQWTQPGRVTGGRTIFARGSEIDFVSPEKKHKSKHSNAPPQNSPSTKTLQTIPYVTQEETKKFYDNLHNSGVKCAVLSILPGYTDAFIPRRIQLKLPPPLTELHKTEHMKLSYPELVQECERVFQVLIVAHDEARSIELETRNQSKSKLWFEMRAGRITASRFKAAARTDPANPAQSLIKQICYPQAYKFSSTATRECILLDDTSPSEQQENINRWGCEHEDVARKAYEQMVTQKHTNLKVEESGLHIHPDYPHLGASPDGLVDCTCCGKGILEIKCPFCKRELSIEEATHDKTFCLANKDGKFHLKVDHAYHYQVQAQLHITGRDYCDFILWTGSDETYVQRIRPNSDFFNHAAQSATMFFKVGILPELLGKWYTRASKRIEPVASTSTDESLVCYCKQPHSGTMIQCKSGSCIIMHFHLKCLGLKNPPKRKWFCPDCRKVMSVAKKK